MRNAIQKLSRTSYRPGLIDLLWLAFTLFGLAAIPADKPKTAFYGLFFAAIIFFLKLAGINRTLIVWLTATSLFQLVGEAAGWYQSIPYFDKIVHALFPIIGSLVAYAILVRFGLAPRPSKFADRHPHFTLGLTVFLLAVAGGVLWEIFEFGVDIFHLSNGSVQYGNLDTMTDLVATFVGAVTAGWVATRVWNKK